MGSVKYLFYIHHILPKWLKQLIKLTDVVDITIKPFKFYENMKDTFQIVRKKKQWKHGAISVIRFTDSINFKMFALYVTVHRLFFC